MSSSLAKELRRLNRAAPKSVDPELEDFGAARDADDSSSDGGRRASRVDDDPEEVRRAPEGRKLRSAVDTVASDPRYSGRSVSRGELFGLEDSGSEDEGDGAAEGDGGESVESLDGPVAKGQQRLSFAAAAAARLADLIDSGSDAEGDGGDSDSQGENSASGDESESEAMLSAEEGDSEGFALRAKPKRPRQDPQHVKNQVSLWSELVGFRIRMQALLTAAERFPRPKQFDEILAAGGEPASQAAQGAAEGARAVLDRLLELREVSGGSPSKVSRPDLGKLSVHEAWAAVAGGNDAAFKSYGATLDLWHRETNIGARQSKLKAVNKVITAQVEDVLAGGEAVLHRSQLRSVDVLPIGERATSTAKVEARAANGTEGAAKSAAARVFDDQVYSDQSFYQELLIGFVSATSATNALRVSEVEDEAVQERLRRKVVRAKQKSKRVVDTRASKGRKIKYVVHDKLVNFVSPKPPMEAPVDTEQLFSSLFSA